MKIVHVIWGLGGGGAERFLTRLVTAPNRRFEHVVVCLTDEGVHGAVVRERGVRLITLGMKRGVPEVRGFVRLYRVLAAEKPDIVQTWMYHSDLLGFLAGKLSGAPVIGWNIRCSDMELRNYRRMTVMTRSVVRLISPMVDFAIVNSIAGKEFHEKAGFRPKRWEVIFNGFDVSEFRPDPASRAAVRAELGIDEKARIIGMIARFDPMKDHATFFQAAAKLAAARVDVHFLLAGIDMTWDHAALARLIGDALRPRVHLLGFRSDVQRILPACDLFTLSSAFGEGFPNVVGEAMSCAVPSVATDVGDSAFLIGDTGRVVPPRDPARLVDAWNELLNLDRESLAALGDRARQRVQRNFDIHSIAQRYETLYSELSGAAHRVGEASHAS